MKRVKSILLSAPFLGFLAVLLLSLAAWFALPLLPIGEPRLFDPVLPRWIVIGALILIWAIFVGIWAWRRKRANDKLIGALAEPEVDPTKEAVDAEAARLREKFGEALKSLQKLRFRSRFGGSKYLYELPWYVFIGPPGSGKTTALLNSGLEFPLKRGEDVSVAGAAGTRDCDWMFTNQAVFIDTAGRYVTQDSHATVDRSAWTTFLDLLARYRPGEPVNGVIVAISLADIATADAATLENHSVAIRRGLLEIAEKMRARTPVYVMFTKADLLAGFNEFFQAMPRESREQVWGVTFPVVEDADPRARAAADLAQLDEELDQLVERLGEAQFRRIQDEADLGTRAQVFGFPTQFSSLKPVIARFLRDTFAPDKFSDPINLRGFYFTSATQEGQPIDRLIGSMAREFGLERRATGVYASQSPRAYFLRGLLEDVVFPEAGLVSRSGGRRVAATAGRWAALAACILAPIALGAGWWMVGRDAAAQTDRFLAEIDAYEAEIAELEPQIVADSQLERVLDPLDRLRAERDRLAEAELFLGGMGAADLEALQAQSEAAYAGALDDLLRPRLLFRLERIMDRELDNPAPLYDALKTYLMLGGRGEMDEAFVGGVIRRDWAQRYDVSLQRDLLERFDRHLVAMFDAMREGRIRRRSLNEESIARARAAAQDVTLAERAYGILMAQDAVRQLEPWRATDPGAGGRAANQVFLRSSGADLEEPIPGVFTYPGFWRVFLPNADAAVAAALDEKWVIAEAEADAQPSLEEVTTTRRGIREVYFRDFIDNWRALLEDLRITPFRDAGHAADTLRTLASGGSPLRSLLQDVARQTDLARAPDPASALATDVVDLGLAPGGSVAGAASAIAGLAGQGPREGQQVSRAFADLRAFVGTAEGGSALEDAIVHLGELRTLASDMAERRVGDLSTLAESPAAVELRRAADGAPPEVRRMFGEMAEAFNFAVVGGLGVELDETWRQTVAPFCQQQLVGRYPFGGGDDVPLGVVSEILGPDGLIDRFFRNRLASMVDTDQVEWRWKGLGPSLGISTERLKFFQRAAELRDAFFPPGSRRPEVVMGVFSVAMHPDVQSARLEIGGEQAEFVQGERGATRLSWPGLTPENGVEAALTIDSGARDISGAPLPASVARVGELGAWGLFKLIDRSEFRTMGAGDRVQLGVSAGGRRVVLQFQMESAQNPLAMRSEIKSFRCPASLL